MIPWPEKVAEEDAGGVELKGVNEMETEKEKAKEEVKDKGNTVVKNSTKQKEMDKDEVKDEGVEEAVKIKEKGLPKMCLRKRPLSAEEAAWARAQEVERVARARLYPGRYKRKRCVFERRLTIRRVTKVGIELVEHEGISDVPTKPNENGYQNQQGDVFVFGG